MAQLQPVTTKATVTTHSSEQSLTLQPGYTQARIKNRNKGAIHWAWKAGQSLNFGVVPAGTMQVIDVPTKYTGTAPVIYFTTFAAGDVFEIEHIN